MALASQTTQLFVDNDGLVRKYGPGKVIPDLGGEYKTYGGLRELEFKIDFATTLGTAASTDVIVSDQVFFPKGVFLEEVVIECQTALATFTSFNLGLVQTNDRTTLIGGAASIGIINAEVIATFAAAGNKVTYVAGTSKAGALIGTVPITSASAFAGHLCGRFVGTPGTGVIIVRLRYRTVV